MSGSLRCPQYPGGLGVNCLEGSGMHACNLHVLMMANLSLVEFLFWIFGGSKHPTKLFFILDFEVDFDYGFWILHSGEN